MTGKAINTQMFCRANIWTSIGIHWRMFVKPFSNCARHEVELIADGFISKVLKTGKFRIGVFLGMQFPFLQLCR